MLVFVLIFFMYVSCACNNVGGVKDISTPLDLETVFEHMLRRWRRWRTNIELTVFFTKLTEQKLVRGSKLNQKISQET
jgi:hypothetical protein